MNWIKSVWSVAERLTRVGIKLVSVRCFHKFLASFRNTNQLWRQKSLRKQWTWLDEIESERQQIRQSMESFMCCCRIHCSISSNLARNNPIPDTFNSSSSPFHSNSFKRNKITCFDFHRLISKIRFSSSHLLSRSFLFFYVHTTATRNKLKYGWVNCLRNTQHLSSPASRVYRVLGRRIARGEGALLETTLKICGWGFMTN